MKKNDAVIGFSVNPELELAVRDTPGPKKVLERMDFCLSGSSGNVAMALKRLGGNPHLLGLVAARHEETLACKLLDEAVRQNKMPFTPIRVLAQTNICVIPVIGEANGAAWGKRNQIVHSAVPNALRDLAKKEDIGIGSNTFTVITGLRSVEIPFAKTLLERTKPGLRILNAKDTLCARKEFKEVLTQVDLLVLNEHEFKETGMTIWDIQSCGPKIVIVTLSKDGGLFSFMHSPCVKFQSVIFPGGVFETGAGDWFLGALISELTRIGESVFTIGREQFQEVVDFAARVAGKKITVPGGGNGPTRSQLRN